MLFYVIIFYIRFVTRVILPKLSYFMVDYEPLGYQTHEMQHQPSNYVFSLSGNPFTYPSKILVNYL